MDVFSFFHIIPCWVNTSLDNSSFKSTDGHFYDSSDSRGLIRQELRKIENGSDPRTRIWLPEEWIQNIARFYPHVTSADDLDTLSRKLSHVKEFGFSHLFDPDLIDACLLRGIFPMSFKVDTVFVFAPKLHNVRMICTPVKDSHMKSEIKYFPPCVGDEGVFCVEKLKIPKRFLKPANNVSKPASFDIFVNRKEDIVDIYTLIREQHGEGWLCKELRKCFFYMQSHEEKFKSKIITIAVRRHKYYDNSSELSPSGDRIVKEGDLIAAEIGFIVGGIYTSATGAYCVNGAGKLQLAVTGCILHELGLKVWDLGMFLDYKKSMLGCVEIERDPWVQMVKHYREYDILNNEKSNEFFIELQKGKNVGEILKGSAKYSKQ